MAGQPHTASEPLGVMCQTNPRAQFTPLPSPAGCTAWAAGSLGWEPEAPRVLPGVWGVLCLKVRGVIHSLAVPRV